MKLAPTEPEHYLTKARMLELSQPRLWLPLVVLFSAGAWLQGFRVDWLWLVCVLYLTLPYGFFMQGVLDGARHRAFRLEFWVVTLAFNIPFWLYIWSQGPADMGLWLVGVLALGVLYDLVNVQVKGMPVFDIVAATFMTIAPFVLGALQSGAGLLIWLPAVVIMAVWLMAEYLRYDLYSPANATNVRSTAKLLGAERVLMVCLGLYLVAALLPVALFGWWGVPVALILTADVLYMWMLVPYRTQPKLPRIVRTNQAMRRAHYVGAALIAIYLLALQNCL